MPEHFPEAGTGPSNDCSGGSISIDQFIALNDELAAIVRAGMPLERSLRETARDIPGTLGSTLQLLSTRLSHGEALPQALAAERLGFPGIYRAIVEAGVKAGRLPIALEGVAAFARTYAELRRAIGYALIYPLIVVSLGYGLFVYFVLSVVPSLLTTYNLFRIPTLRLLELLAACRATLPFWGPALPIVLGVIGLWWFKSGRVQMLEPSWSRRLWGWLPWLHGIFVNARSACFAELLALLVEHGIPLDEAILLSAEATGDKGLLDEARQIATRVAMGNSAESAIHEASLFPPMLRWLMVTGLKQGLLSSSLRHASETYRDMALQDTAMAKQLLPIAFLLALGGTTSFIYCLSVFVPFTSLVLDLCKP